jgi:glycosyltransferase involved in cell wall biosynthesis
MAPTGNEAPAVSVITPVRDGEDFVADAIESVLAQQGVSLELIVVDDGSIDGTPQILERYAGRITVATLEGCGLSAARNRGIELAHGELLVFLDADDLLPPVYLARFADAAAAAPSAEVFHCGWQGTDLDGRFLYGQDGPYDYDGDPFHTLAAEGSPPISALAVRRGTATRVGPFDENESMHADWDYWLRLAAAGAAFHGVEGNIAIVRRHPDSMSARAGTSGALSGLAVLERHLAAHERCPACARADAGVRLWRQAVLNSSDQDFALRLRLGGRLGTRIGAAIAVVRRPRLASEFWAVARPRRTIRR